MSPLFKKALKNQAESIQSLKGEVGVKDNCFGLINEIITTYPVII